MSEVRRQLVLTVALPPGMLLLLAHELLQGIFRAAPFRTTQNTISSDARAGCIDIPSLGAAWVKIKMKDGDA
jgi:hypothetical protein